MNPVIQVLFRPVSGLLAEENPGGSVVDSVLVFDQRWADEVDQLDRLARTNQPLQGELHMSSGFAQPFSSDNDPNMYLSAITKAPKALTNVGLTVERVL